MTSPPVAVTSDVAVLRWPSDADARRRMAALGVPRLLVVDPGVAPPDLLDELEDWVRGPLPAEAVPRAALDALRHRATARRSGPALDEDGLLRHDGRWVYVPDAQLPVVALLVRRFGRLVRTEELRAAYTAAGGSGHSGSIRTVIARVRARVAVVGLELHAVRRRGVLLDAAGVS